MLPSNSGCELWFMSDVVLKVGNKRLQKSCEKQRTFDSWFVKTPEVFDSFMNHDYFAFSMERINDATTIFHAPGLSSKRRRRSAHECDCLTKIFCYVRRCLSKSRWCSLPAEMFIDKIKSIEGVESYPEAEDLIKRFESADTIRLPCGPMHGDLTFCNVLCRDTNVWFLDFMDGFVSSPVFDVAKMRQDSYYGWIELFENAPNRDYIDDRVLREFGYLPWLRELTLLALLRIIPYAKTPSVINFLKEAIPRAYADLSSSGS